MRPRIFTPTLVCPIIDRAHPLSRGLLAVQAGHSPVNLVNNKPSTPGGSGIPSLIIGPYGPGRNHVRSPDSCDEYAIPNIVGDLTIFLVGGLTQTEGSFNIAVGVLRSGGNSVWLGNRGSGGVALVTEPVGGSAVVTPGGGTGDHIFVGRISNTTMQLFKNGASLGTATQSNTNWGTLTTFRASSTSFLSQPHVNIYLTGVANRAWTDEEVEEFSADPWCFFVKPRRRYLILDDSSGPGGEDPEPISGTFAKTLDIVTQTAAGKVIVSSAFAETLPTLIQTASGKLIVAATSEQALSLLTQTGAGAVVVKASASVNLDLPTQIAQGTIGDVVHGSANQTLGLLTQTASAKAIVQAALNQQLPAITQAAEAALIAAAYANITLDPPTVAAIAGPVVAGEVAKTLDLLTQQASGLTGVTIRAITADITLGNVVLTADGKSYSVRRYLRDPPLPYLKINR